MPGWDLKQVARREYAISPERPLHVSSKLHPSPVSERFDMHYALELGVVVSGRMDRIYQNHSRSLKSGDVWLCGAWEPHGFRVSKGACRALVVSIFPPMLAATRFAELPAFDWLSAFVTGPAERPAVSDDQRPVVQALARQLAESLGAPEPARFVVQRMLVYQLLLQLPAADNAAGGAAEDDYARVNRAIDLVFRNKGYVPSSEAARQCALSPKAFAALFLRTMGTSFSKFSMSYRLQGAATQLLETGDPLKAIARDWGFVDASHFHGCFRTAYGCSPARYRAEPSVSARHF